MLNFAIFFILGLIFGSFLNVVVYRLSVAENILGRSFCPSCRKKIQWKDNIPVISYLLLSAKCRNCGEKISQLYPAVEILTGLVFASIGFYFFDFSNASSWISTAFMLAIFFILLIIFVYDLRHMEIPMIAIWVGVGVSLLYSIFLDYGNFQQLGNIFSLNLTSGIIGGIFAFVFFFSFVYFSKETWMGMGDAYLGFLAGLIVGWPAILGTLVLSFTAGAIAGIILVVTKKKGMQSQVPFAPFMIIGIFLAIFISKFFPDIKYFLIGL